MESAAELIYWGCRSNSEFYEGFTTLQYWAVSSCLQQQGGRVYVVIWEGGDMYLVWSGLFTVYNGLAAYSRPAPLLPICVLLCIKCPHSFYSLSLSAVISPDCPEPGCHLQMVSAPLSTHWPWWPQGVQQIWEIWQLHTVGTTKRNVDGHDFSRLLLVGGRVNKQLCVLSAHCSRHQTLLLSGHSADCSVQCMTTGWSTQLSTNPGSFTKIVWW